MYPHVLNIIIAIGRPGRAYPMISSVITLQMMRGRRQRRISTNSLETNLLVGNSLNHANRNNVEKGCGITPSVLILNHLRERTDCQGKAKSPHRELGMPHLDDDNTKHEHGHCQVNTGVRRVQRSITGYERTKDDRIPPFGDLLILGHQACMDIRLLAHRTLALDPDLFSEKE